MFILWEIVIDFRDGIGEIQTLLVAIEVTLRILVSKMFKPTFFLMTKVQRKYKNQRWNHRRIRLSKDMDLVWQGIELKAVKEAKELREIANRVLRAQRIMATVEGPTSISILWRLKVIIKQNKVLLKIKLINNTHH